MVVLFYIGAVVAGVFMSLVWIVKELHKNNTKEKQLKLREKQLQKHIKGKQKNNPFEL